MTGEVRVKICGLKTAEAIDAAVEEGAAFIGFNFYKPSPRYVAPADVAALAARVPAGVTRVGLFVNPSDDELAETLAVAPLDMLQLHGGETSERVAAVRARFGRSVLKVITVAAVADVAAAERYLGVADWLMFDAKPPRGGLPGGNGIPFDWRLLAGHHWRLPWMLAGGLTAATLGEAVRLAGTTTVDVSSGVESAPGVKDTALIRAFLAAAKSLSSAVT